MSKLSEFFGRKRDLPSVDKDSAHANEKRDNSDGEHFGYESQSEIDLRIGEENEALHNLLVDTERKIGELDGLKDAFGKIIVPFNNTLRALEQEKFQNASLKDTLDKSHGAYEKLRTKLYEVERKATAFEAKTKRLKEDPAARETARALENNRTEQMWLWAGVRIALQVLGTAGVVYVLYAGATGQIHFGEKPPVAAQSTPQSGRPGATIDNNKTNKAFSVDPSPAVPYPVPSLFDPSPVVPYPAPSTYGISAGIVFPQGQDGVQSGSAQPPLGSGVVGSESKRVRTIAIRPDQAATNDGIAASAPPAAATSAPMPVTTETPVKQAAPAQPARVINNPPPATDPSPAVPYPVPSTYGVYALSNNYLSELEALPIKMPDPRIMLGPEIKKPSLTTVASGKLAFIVFRRELMNNAPEKITVRVVAQVARETRFSNGKATVTKIKGAWRIRANSYELKISPVPGSREMVIGETAPDVTLPPGRYALVLNGLGYDFTVAGSITSPEQCLERFETTYGDNYTECRAP